MLKIASSFGILLFLVVAGLLLVSSFSIPGINLDARVVLTGSMEPAIPTGSVVFVSLTDVYAEGDIITFETSSGAVPVTHRITAVRVASGEYIYTTKGDANDVADTREVRNDQVLGKVQFHIPYLGYLLNAAKTPLGFIVLIVGPALLVMADEVRSIAREIRNRKQSESGAEAGPIA